MRKINAVWAPAQRPTFSRPMTTLHSVLVPEHTHLNRFKLICPFSNVVADHTPSRTEDIYRKPVAVPYFHCRVQLPCIHSRSHTKWKNEVSVILLFTQLSTTHDDPPVLYPSASPTIRHPFVCQADLSHSNDYFLPLLATFIRHRRSPRRQTCALVLNIHSFPAMSASHSHHLQSCSRKLAAPARR